MLRQLHWLLVRQRVVFKIAGLVHSRLLERLPRTSYLADDCRLLSGTLVVAHCGPTPITCGSCSCREHITNSVTGVCRPPVLDCGTTFHPDYGGRDSPWTPSDSVSETSFIWRPKCLVATEFIGTIHMNIPIYPLKQV